MQRLLIHQASEFNLKTLLESTKKSRPNKHMNGVDINNSSNEANNKDGDNVDEEDDDKDDYDKEGERKDKG